MWYGSSYFECTTLADAVKREIARLELVQEFKNTRCCGGKRENYFFIAIAFIRCEYNMMMTNKYLLRSSMNL